MAASQATCIGALQRNEIGLLLHSKMAVVTWLTQSICAVGFYCRCAGHRGEDGAHSASPTPTLPLLTHWPECPPAQGSMPDRAVSHWASGILHYTIVTRVHSNYWEGFWCIWLCLVFLRVRVSACLFVSELSHQFKLPCGFVGVFEFLFERIGVLCICVCVCVYVGV